MQKQGFLDLMLKPLWQALATPGLGNPHTPYETELLVAGVKSVAIIDAHESAKLQSVLSTGQVVHIADEEFIKEHRLYYHPEACDSAEKVAQILQTSWNNSTELLDTPTLKELFAEKDVTPDKEMASITHRSYLLAKAIYFNDDSPDVEKFLEHRIMALPPLHMTEDIRIPDTLAEAHSRGLIGATHFNTRQTISVYAQADKIEEGKELHARYYGRNNGSYPPMATFADETARIGNLLGFTDNDIAWHLGTKYQNPLIMRVMEATIPLRQHARLKTMLGNAKYPMP